MFILSVTLWGLLYFFAFDSNSTEKITVFLYAEQTENLQLKRKISSETNVDTYISICKDENEVFPKPPLNSNFFTSDIVIIPEKCLINLDCKDIFVPLSYDILTKYEIEGDFEFASKNNEDYGIVVYSHDDGINLLKRFAVFKDETFIVCISKLTPNAGEYSVVTDSLKTENSFKALKALLN